MKENAARLDLPRGVFLRVGFVFHEMIGFSKFCD
jgi:hypothetical protein